jgi:OmpA-OmpF porin, OOP family
MKTSQSIKINSISSKRYSSNCYINFSDGNTLECSSDLVLKYNLSPDSVIPLSIIDIIQKEQRIFNIKQSAYQFASYKKRTKKQVSQRLAQKGYSDSEIRLGLEFLIEFNLIDDKEFAHLYVRDNVQRRPVSQNRLLSEMIQKGIPKELALEAIKENYPTENKLEIAKESIEKKIKTISHKPKDKQKKLIIAHLQRQGFDWDTIKQAIQNLKICIIFLLTILLSLLFTARIQSQPLIHDSICKIRLPETVNSYQPSIIPVLTSDGKYLFLDRKVHPENSGGINDQDDIWFSRSLGTGLWSEPEHLSIINTPVSDVIFAITPDRSKALIYSSRTPQSYFSIYQLNGSKLSNPKPLNIKNYYNLSKNFFASISPDNRILILSIERKDSYGSKDLYVSIYDEPNGLWSEPKNLGNIINTSGDEEAPFLAYDLKTLYFSSDGKNNKTKQDLFVTRRLDDSWLNWSEPENLGPLFNTKFDENSIWLTILSDTAYIVSGDTIEKRPGIYFACMPEKLRPMPYLVLKGNILTIFNGKVVPYQKSIKVVVKEKKSKKTTYYYSDSSSANLIFTLPAGLETDILIDEPGFKPYSFYLSSRDIKTITQFNKDIVLDPFKPLQDHYTVYFEFNDFSISDDNQNKLSDFVLNTEDYKDKKYILIGHTDSTGTEKYNYNLSKNRAEVISRFLQALGVPKSSIEVYYKGASEPASNEDAKNRRVEIVVGEK